MHNRISHALRKKAIFLCTNRELFIHRLKILHRPLSEGRHGAENRQGTAREGNNIRSAIRQKGFQII
jgi:hypothetical protein